MAQTLNITSEDLRRLAVFNALAAATLDDLVRSGKGCHWARNQELASLDTDNDETYYFLLRGIATIAVGPRSSQSAPEPRHRRQLFQGHELLGYFEAGACFSDAFLREHDKGPFGRLFCKAANDVSALTIGKKHLRSLLDRDPLLRSRLAEHMAKERASFLSRQAPTSRTIQDFFLRENYVTSTVVRLSQLDRCLDCDKCHNACAARHGSARMARVGPRLGRIAFRTTCHNCTDRPCIASCSIGALTFDELSDGVVISDRCTGCGACAKQCPNGAISMIGLPPDERSKAASVRTKRQRAVKCDNCSGHADQACITACPTGALMEVRTEKLFILDNPEQAQGFSTEPFLRSRKSGRKSAWVAFLTLLFLAAIGLECYTAGTNPDASLLIRTIQAPDSKASVSFTSGQGVGHWLGYVGSSMMLASILYSLRTRIRALRRWGSQTGWLSAHIWLGFTGGALVTFHSTLKLNRWASIGCILMWLVIATGIIGRYLYGQVRSAEGVAAFGRESLRESGHGGTYYSGLERILRHWNIVHIILVIAMVIVAGTHIVYGFRYKAF